MVSYVRNVYTFFFRRLIRRSITRRSLSLQLTRTTVLSTVRARRAETMLLLLRVTRSLADLLQIPWLHRVLNIFLARISQFPSRNFIFFFLYKMFWFSFNKYKLVFMR